MFLFTQALPLYGYLLEELLSKLDSVFSQRKTGFWSALRGGGGAPAASLAAAPGMRGMTPVRLLQRIQPLFPALCLHMDLAVKALGQEEGGGDPTQGRAGIGGQVVREKTSMILCVCVFVCVCVCVYVWTNYDNSWAGYYCP
jgi:hypothetical protein